VSDPFVGRAGPFKTRGPFRGIRAPFRGWGRVFGRYPSRTNSIRNSAAAGAVAGTPGTAPTNWTFSALSGLTREITATGTGNGFAYVEVRLYGTAGSAFNNASWLGFEVNNIISAASGQTWTASVFTQLISASMGNAGIRLRVTEFASGSSVANSTKTYTPTATMERTTLTRTLSNGTTTHVQSGIVLDAANGAAVDFTIRIYAPQLEQGAFATAQIQTTSAAVTRKADTLVIAE